MYVYVEVDGEEQLLGFYLPSDLFSLDTNGSEDHMSSTISLENASVCRFLHVNLDQKEIGINLLKIFCRTDAART